MDLTTFIDHRYQELALQTQINKEAYSISKDAEMKALQQLLSFHRACFKWISYPKILFHFFMVKCGWETEPTPALTNKLKAQDEERKKKQEELKAREEELALQAAEIIETNAQWGSGELMVSNLPGAPLLHE